MTDKETQIYLVARFLMDEYGLSDWSLKLWKMPRARGRTFYGRKLIKLSSVAINQRSYRHSINTILHEIAHGISPVHGHGREWKAACRQIGALPKASASDSDIEIFLGEY